MEVKPLSGLTKFLRVLLMLDIALSSLAVCVACFDCYSYANLPEGMDASLVLLPSDVATLLVGLVQSILFLILGITFLRWIYRANKNLRTLSGEEMEFTPGWSVGWYFIPFANLVKPYQAMREIWEVSHKDEPTTHTLLGWWWFFWITANIVSNISGKMAIRAEGVDDFIASALAYVISDGLNVVLSIVALMLVTRIAMAYSRNIVEPGAPDWGNAGDLTMRRGVDDFPT